jgi:threonylcarbamoyladenosine tRNA methylthiotransferase MtaB
MKHAVITFGCRVNQADSQQLEAELCSRLSACAAPEDADVVIVNTCSVTSSADQGARQIIRRVARSNPRARIVVTGCYASRAAHEVAQLPQVVSVLAIAAKPRLVGVLQALVEENQAALTTAARFGDGDGACGAVLEPGLAGRTAFTLRVQTGCDEACSYCIIPATRGRPRSTPLDEVRHRLLQVLDAGFQEVILTGVHLGSYGRDLSPPSSLEKLLDMLDASTAGNGVLLRISSLEPMDCERRVVDLVAGSSRFAPHFHLPLQHASDRLLAAMRRPYSLASYSELVDGIRRRLPHASIGSDVIVGFPGETDEDFRQLTGYLEGSPLTHLHVFPYSDRPGTRASRLGDKVPGGIIRDRAREVREISTRLSWNFRAGQLGSVHRALTIDDGSIGVTPNYLKLKLDQPRPRNRWIEVRVTGSPARLEGQVIEGAPSNSTLAGYR